MKLVDNRFRVGTCECELCTFGGQCLSGLILQLQMMLPQAADDFVYWTVFPIGVLVTAPSVLMLVLWRARAA